MHTYTQTILMAIFQISLTSQLPLDSLPSFLNSLQLPFYWQCDKKTVQVIQLRRTLASSP